MRAQTIRASHLAPDHVHLRLAHPVVLEEVVPQPLQTPLVADALVGRLVVDELGDVLLVDGEVGHVDAVLAQAPRVLAVFARNE